MNSERESLTALDRRTLTFWRVSNIAGWMLVALVAAYILQALLANLETIIIEGGLVEDYRLADQVELWIAIAATVLSGVALGSIIGRRVYRSAPAYAGMAAALHAFPLAVIQVSIHSDGWIAHKLATFGIAIAVAAWSEKRRPLALRGGRGAALPE